MRVASSGQKETTGAEDGDKGSENGHWNREEQGPITGRRGGAEKGSTAGAEGARFVIPETTILDAAKDRSRETGEAK